MSEHTVTITRDEAGEFVAAVRRHLADLPAEEQQELTEGLEADLSEQVEDGGSGALGDPGDYARELRAAAGLAPAGTSLRRGHLGVEHLLDEAHARWNRWVERVPGDTAGFLVALRPAWWLVRAWTALALVLVLIGHGNDIAVVPTPRDNLGIGLALLVLATLVSVQIGRCRIWPGTARRRGSASARVVLLLLNLLAAVTLPFLIGSNQITVARADAYFTDESDGAAPPPYALAYEGRAVDNVYPYDAKGNPLIGVQLLDQDGRTLTVPEDSNLLTPWTDADQDDLYGVFPLPSKIADASGNVHGDARIRPPYRHLKPVTLPGFVASVLTQPGRSTADASTKAKQSSIQ